MAAGAEGHGQQLGARVGDGGEPRESLMPWGTTGSLCGMARVWHMCERGCWSPPSFARPSTTDASTLHSFPGLVPCRNKPLILIQVSRFSKFPCP